MSTKAAKFTKPIRRFRVLRDHRPHNLSIRRCKSMPDVFGGRRPAEHADTDRLKSRAAIPRREFVPRDPCRTESALAVHATLAGVGIGYYSRRLRQGPSEARFPACGAGRHRPNTSGMPSTSLAYERHFAAIKPIGVLVLLDPFLNVIRSLAGSELDDARVGEAERMKRILLDDGLDQWVSVSTRSWTRGHGLSAVLSAAPNRRILLSRAQARG
jgi:hypothetical protein